MLTHFIHTYSSTVRFQVFLIYALPLKVRKEEKVYAKICVSHNEGET